MRSRMGGGDKRWWGKADLRRIRPPVYLISYSRNETFCRGTTALTQDIVRTLHSKNTTMPASGLNTQTRPVLQEHGR